MTDPEITIQTVSHVVSVPIEGTDGQGRPLIRCRYFMCTDLHPIVDGQIHCPTNEATTAYLARAAADVQAAFGHLLPPGVTLEYDTTPVDTP